MSDVVEHLIWLLSNALSTARSVDILSWTFQEGRLRLEPAARHLVWGTKRSGTTSWNTFDFPLVAFIYCGSLRV